MNATKETVRRKYGDLARQAESGSKACCDTVSADLYGGDELAGIPEAAANASLGCGNPTMLAQLHPGEIVLDLGSGGGIDVLLSARRVAPTGKAYGLDMTDEMLALARENQRKAGVANVEFLKGEIENIPLPDQSIDVIISNCVINLSGDKAQVLREAFRVLRPGGRFAVSDLVRHSAAPAISPAALKEVEKRLGCVVGALNENEYVSLLADAGFESIDIEPTREHEAGFFSAFIRATKIA
jgi:arsenite methyltransferase